MARRLSSLSSSEVTLPALTRLWVLRMLVLGSAVFALFIQGAEAYVRALEEECMHAQARTPTACHRIQMSQACGKNLRSPLQFALRGVEVNAQDVRDS